MHRSMLVGFLAASVLAGCASTYRVLPVESAPSTVRFDHGVPTTSLIQRNGAVQVTPISSNADGKMVFAVAALNQSPAIDNFGLENISVQSMDKTLHVYTVNDLIREERNKALAADFALALVGAAGAALSEASAHQTYRSTFTTPHGTYMYKATYYNQAQAAAGIADSIGGASAGMLQVQQALDATIAGIGNSVLQTTTIDPGQSVGGRILVQRPRLHQDPQPLNIYVRWNGENYFFPFALTNRAAMSLRAAEMPAVSPTASVSEPAPRRTAIIPAAAPSPSTPSPAPARAAATGPVPEVAHARLVAPHVSLASAPLAGTGGAGADRKQSAPAVASAPATASRRAAAASSATEISADTDDATNQYPPSFLESP